ncbi:hypothetical protein CI109_101830 [Kwoniella shandongensis]|uniref:Uncharacterized protein n=1 Tax=Kwoniella shandongensis TaxID=1734106 RepID=A0A5M6C555_9TREE|nr:uncharacterized protein CI109_001048 [Kwoniella shandongensis]KAA5530248.1 hypothetical protein CI109_001048 [Kwoniella shandongensis]
MKVFTALAASLPAVASMPVMAGLSISGPESLFSCTPTTYSWTPTHPPYTVSTYDYSISDIPSLIDEPVVIPDYSTATWVLDVRPGRNISVMVVDAKGNSAETWPRVVGFGNTHCFA